MSFPLMPVVSPSSAPGVEWYPAGSISGVSLGQVSVSPGGVWVVTGGSLGRVYSSTNYGTTWSTRSTAGVSSMLGSAYGAGLFAVSEEFSDRVSTSSDGVSWTSRFTGATDNYSARFNDGYFVIGVDTASGGAILASGNGTSWTLNPQGVLGAALTRCGIYVASLGRTFAAGASSQAKYVNAIPTSATAWTGTSTGVPTTSYDVAWSPTGSVAVLVGSGGIYSSTDLITWTRRIATSNFYGVSWCDTQFVAVGSGGKISTSPNGVTWTTRTSGTANDLYGVAAQGGVILVTGLGGTVLRSS